MNKPNNPKCDTCFVVDNFLRCWGCKYKTPEWKYKNLKPIMIIGENDLHKQKTKR